jgi:ABC-type sugar transport system permease subunit
MRRGRYAPYVAIAPAAAVLALVMVVPVVQIFRLAFSEVGATGLPGGFNGLDNFHRLFADPTFVKVSINTLVWTAGVLIPATVISMALALGLNAKFRGRAVARSIVFLPWAISFVFVAIIWRLVLDRYFGHLNAALSTITGTTIDTAWLSTPKLAMLSVIWVGITLTIPFTTIVLLSGLQAIPAELMEAARIDGAGGIKTFRYVTLPLLQPVIAVASLVNLLFIFNSFPIIWTMTGGGPANSTDTFATYLYRIAFSDLDFGKASALSVVGFVFLITISVVYVRTATREEL